MSDILTHTDAGVMTITFNRLDKKNSITAAMYAAMADAVAQAGADPSVRVVVFQGHESIFSAGNDIGDFLNQPPTTQESPVFRFLRGIATFEKPLLAAVAGPAVGIGTTLLFHCDLVYAGDNAAFSMPFVNLGLCPEAASSLLAPRMFGYHRAAEALLMREPFFAEAAPEGGAAHRSQRLRAGTSPQVGRQALVIAHRHQAPHEGRHPSCAEKDGRRRPRLWPHAARTRRQRGFWRFHGKTQTRLQQGLTGQGRGAGGPFSPLRPDATAR